MWPKEQNKNMEKSQDFYVNNATCPTFMLINNKLLLVKWWKFFLTSKSTDWRSKMPRNSKIFRTFSKATTFCNAVPKGLRRWLRSQPNFAKCWGQIRSHLFLSSFKLISPYSKWLNNLAQPKISQSFFTNSKSLRKLSWKLWAKTTGYSLCSMVWLMIFLLKNTNSTSFNSVHN